MPSKLNGTLKYAGIPVSVLVAAALIILRGGASEEVDFAEKYDKRIRTLEAASIRAEEQRKSIIKTQEGHGDTLKRIEVKLDEKPRR